MRLSQLQPHCLPDLDMCMQPKSIAQIVTGAKVALELLAALLMLTVLLKMPIGRCPHVC